MGKRLKQMELGYRENANKNEVPTIHLVIVVIYIKFNIITFEYHINVAFKTTGISEIEIEDPL